MLSNPYVTDCPVCGFGSEHAFRKIGHNIVKCSNCDFMFVHPYPTPDKLTEYYNANYRKASADFYPKAMSRRQRCLQRALLLAPHLWGKSVLELGCGGGFMSWAMSFFARETTGVDISEGSIAYAKAHFPRSEFQCADLKAVAEMGRTFDLVFSSELLEHLPGVKEFMAAIVATTRPGSLVYVSAPDISHRSVPRNVAEWGDICPPEHLQWFGKHNLARLFAMHDFEVYRYMYAPKAAHNVLFRRR